MQLRRITVRNFRKLTSPVDLDALGDGVTVIAGDNEEGKSTLLDAIRSGLFQRHNVTGRPVEDMQPFGSRVRPEVCLEFQANGNDYRIEKGFGHKPTAHLTTPDGLFEGPEAEEHLAELLNFRIAPRGASKVDDWGVLGLFWLEQGKAADGLMFGEAGRSTLRGALEDEVGDVLGGSQGRVLLDAARHRRGELLTGTGRQTGALAESVAAVAAAEEQVRDLEQSRAEYDAEIDELARVCRELDRIDADQVIETSRDALAAARAEAGVIETLRGQVESADQTVALAEARASNLADRWQQRQAIIQTLTDAERDAAEASRQQSHLEAEAASLTTALDKAAQRLASATKQRHHHQQRVDRAEAAARIARLEKEILMMRETLAQVEHFSAERSAARTELKAISLNQSSFDRLQALDTEVRESRAALQAVATRIHFLPENAQEVRRDGEPVSTDRSVEITRTTRFTLEGFGAVDVEPGASELEQRQRQLEASEQALARALLEGGAKDLAGAREILSRRTAAQARIQETTRLIEAHAKDGEAPLREALSDGEETLKRLQAGHDTDCHDGPVDPDQERQQVIAAGAAETAARDALDAARLEHQAHTTRLALATQQVEAATRARHDAANELESARKSITDADLALGLETAKAAHAQAIAGQEVTRQRLRAANPQEAVLREKKAAAALEQVQQEQARLREQRIALQSHLSALGRDGIAEQLEDSKGALDRVVQRRDHLVHEAAAWDLLVTTLQRAERNAKEAFLGPVLERVDPFLQLILPGARVSLDEETLEITGISRDGRDEPYQSLSVGTREQLAILVRLAFAVYLREKNFPATVILDDALVYADDDRFERMQLALHKAAESVQILILTCRPRDWRQFGAPIRRLAAARSGASDSS